MATEAEGSGKAPSHMTQIIEREMQGTDVDLCFSATSQ